MIPEFFFGTTTLFGGMGLCGVVAYKIFSRGNKTDASQKDSEQSTTAQSITSQFDKFNKWFQKTLEKTEVVSLAEYDKTMKYFVTNRPNDMNVKKGAILRQKHPQGYLLTQVFLDDKSQFVYNSEGKPYLRQTVAKKLDEELHHTFKNNDLIIVE